MEGQEQTPFTPTRQMQGVRFEEPDPLEETTLGPSSGWLAAQFPEWSWDEIYTRLKNLSRFSKLSSEGIILLTGLTNIRDMVIKAEKKSGLTVSVVGSVQRREEVGETLAAVSAQLIYASTGTVIDEILMSVTKNAVGLRITKDRLAHNMMYGEVTAEGTLLSAPLGGRRFSARAKDIAIRAIEGSAATIAGRMGSGLDLSSLNLDDASAKIHELKQIIEGTGLDEVSSLQLANLLCGSVTQEDLRRINVGSAVKYQVRGFLSQLLLIPGLRTAPGRSASESMYNTLITEIEERGEAVAQKFTSETGISVDRERTASNALLMTSTPASGEPMSSRSGAVNEPQLESLEQENPEEGMRELKQRRGTLEARQHAIDAPVERMRSVQKGKKEEARQRSIERDLDDIHERVAMRRSSYLLELFTMVSSGAGVQAIKRRTIEMIKTFEDDMTRLEGNDVMTHETALRLRSAVIMFSDVLAVSSMADVVATLRDLANRMTLGSRAIEGQGIAASRRVIEVLDGLLADREGETKARAGNFVKNINEALRAITAYTHQVREGRVNYNELLGEAMNVRGPIDQTSPSVVALQEVESGALDAETAVRSLLIVANPVVKILQAQLNKEAPLSTEEVVVALLTP